MSRNNKTVLALLAVAGLAAVAYALLPAGPDPDLVKVQQLQEKLFDPNAKLSDDERREGFRELRTASENLTDDQRTQVFRENPMARRMRQSVVEYFDLPEDKRVALLDKHIDEMEKFRKQAEKRRAERREKGDGPPPNWGNRDGAGGDPNAMRKRMLDNTSPTERAMFGEYFKQLGERRQQRGLPPMGGPFGQR